METKKMSLATMQGKLNRDEMKNIQGGIDPIGGDGCMEEYVYHCGAVRTPYPCCEGLECVDNATNSGTLCMAI